MESLTRSCPRELTLLRIVQGEMTNVCGCKEKKAYVRSRAFVGTYIVFILSFVSDQARGSSGTYSLYHFQVQLLESVSSPRVVLLTASRSAMHILIRSRSCKAPVNCTEGQCTQLLRRREVALAPGLKQAFLAQYNSMAIVLTTGSDIQRQFQWKLSLPLLNGTSCIAFVGYILQEPCGRGQGKSKIQTLSQRVCVKQTLTEGLGSVCYFVETLQGRRKILLFNFGPTDPPCSFSLQGTSGAKPALLIKQQ